ncbi:shikimate kinase [Candidatus Nitrosacidococcus sp. I8]|uniref:shikimate kinase n=1 Tax=Candidatus Nitrosacidococcus sp. I8 TaxID=2942908 RepID=UPI002227E173|nr:shikimate kinase [Candidatus Nitrosacidococcus sp. I8]
MVQQNIFFIGPMGVGKTTIGKSLAKILGKTFYDSDHEIEQSTQASIPTIFDIEGEEGFRLREYKTITELVKLNNIVLATGGGAILNEKSRMLLAAQGLVVYLYAPVEFLYRRIAYDKNRPLLQKDNPLDYLTQLFHKRDPLYREISDITICTEKKTIKAITDEILHRLRPIE